MKKNYYSSILDEFTNGDVILAEEIKTEQDPDLSHGLPNSYSSLCGYGVRCLSAERLAE